MRSLVLLAFASALTAQTNNKPFNPSGPAGSRMTQDPASTRVYYDAPNWNSVMFQKWWNGDVTVTVTPKPVRPTSDALASVPLPQAPTYPATVEWPTTRVRQVAPTPQEPSSGSRLRRIFSTKSVDETLDILNEKK